MSKSKSKASLDGDDLATILGISASISRGGGASGRPGEYCCAMTFVIQREAFNPADSHAFELFANGDGRRRLFPARIELLDDHDETLVLYELERAYLSSYQLSSDGSGATVECLILQSGLVDASSGPGKAKFHLDAYDRKTNR